MLYYSAFLIKLQADTCSTHINTVIKNKIALMQTLLCDSETLANEIHH